jgi:uncharacterized repeat protein (TIGR01451 family)
MRYCTRTILGLVMLIAFVSMALLPISTVYAQANGIRISKIVASGFNLPVAITNAGDGSNRLFVVEQHSGLIRIAKGGSVLPTPFLNLSGLITLGGEQGLLGLAFHPNYAANGFFYVYYTDRIGVGNSVVARYHVSANPDVADAGSAVQILNVSQPYANHNGGTLLFGPDGYLYVGLGDGGSGGDPQNNAQNKETLLGKILRLDVDGGSPYAIPPTNPFSATAGRDEIWAYGLRNPWKFSFDHQNGDLYIGDVGQNLYEEIDFQAAGIPGGVNFGWRCMEATHLYTSVAPCNDPIYLNSLTAPIAEYNHSQGFSVTGGNVYRGVQFPALQGKYFYADYGGSTIWSLRKNAVPPYFSAPVVELSNTGIAISTFGEDEQGELYLADYNGGTIRQVEDISGPVPALGSSNMQVSSPTANQGETVNYSINLVNQGGAAAGVQLTHVLAANLTYVSNSLSAGAVYTNGNRTISWTGTVPAQSTISISYDVTVDVVAPNGSINQYAAISGASIQSLMLGVSLNVLRPVLTTTGKNFYLPGTQPGSLVHQFQTSADCDTCHTAPIYDRWRGSPMSQAGRDPLMWAALRVSNSYAPNSGEFCLRCHTPKGWLEGRSQAADGTGLTIDDIRNGVACLSCHRMVDTIASPNDEATGIDALVRLALAAQGNLPPGGTTGSAMMLIDPSDNRRGPFSLAATFTYHIAKRTDLLGQNGSAITRSRMCGTCHNLSNPLLSWDAGRGQYWPNPADQKAADFSNEMIFPIERTFDEWALSTYANGGVIDFRFSGSKPGGLVETCQDCHMPRVIGKAADDSFNPVLRDCVSTGCLPQHDLLGANTWIPDLLQQPDWRFNAAGESAILISSKQSTQTFLKKSATIRTEMGPVSGGKRAVTVRVVNQTGHKLPTGYPEGRRMWIYLEAYDANNNLVFQSGAYNTATGDLTIDPGTKIYEAKLGLTPELAALTNLPAGESFFFTLNNTVIKDNRIPPRGYSVSAFDRPGLRPVGTTFVDGQYWDDTVYQVPGNAVRVMAVLYYQTASKEYVQFLGKYGGVDGEKLAAMWQVVKSPPQVIDEDFTPAFITFLGLINR